MLQPDRKRADVARAAVGRLHDAGAAAGDHRVAGAPQARADLARERVVGVLRGRARGAEHRDRAADLRERVEAARELRGDVADALGVGGAHPGGSSPNHSSSSSSSVCAWVFVCSLDSTAQGYALPAGESGHARRP